MKVTKFSVDSSDGMNLSAYRYDTEAGRLGPAILFAHANGFHGHCFDPTIEDLIEKYECISFDLRGHGDSTISSDWSVAWQGYGDDALAIAKEISTPTIAVGHSMGGAALIMAALAVPKLFRALIVYEPIIFPSAIREIAFASGNTSPIAEGARRRRKIFSSRADAFANYASKPPMNLFDPRALRAFVDYGFKDTSDGVELKCAPEHEARNFETGAIHDTWDHLKKLTVPTWVVSGAPQPGQPSNLAVTIAEQITNSHFIEWQDSDHFGPMQQPERLATLIREIVDLTSPNS